HLGQRFLIHHADRQHGAILAAQPTDGYGSACDRIQAKATGEFYTAEVASSLWLGAQATNAEAIPFQGRAEQTLLLHFWPLTVLVFAPQQIDADGQGEFVGYVLAIPEVADLENFLADYPIMLGDLSDEIRGYRPAEAILDLPAQGA